MSAPVGNSALSVRESVPSCPRTAGFGEVRRHVNQPSHGFWVIRAGLDITSIDIRPEAPDEPPRSPGDDGVHVVVHLQPVFERSVHAACRVVRPYKSAPYMGFGLLRAGFDIICVDIRRETPDGLSGSPGDDGVASWSF